MGKTVGEPTFEPETAKGKRQEADALDAHAKIMREQARDLRRPANAMEAVVVRCVECGRAFDLTDAAQAEEWHYGHDCEV